MVSYKDYWRFTPSCVRGLFKENGLETIYLNHNDHKNSAIYIFAVATRNPERYAHVMPDSVEEKVAGDSIGKNLRTFLERLKDRYVK